MENIGMLFNKYEVKFPVDQNMVIIIGMNGTGKTQTLELLNNYYKKNGENVLYFPVNRKLLISKEEAKNTQLKYQVMNKLSNDKIFYIDNYDNFEFVKKGDYICNGNLQCLNFITQIDLAGDNVRVLIDMPERNLDMINKRNFINSLNNLSNVKQLVIVTHSLAIIDKYGEKTYDIQKFVDLFE